MKKQLLNNWLLKFASLVFSFTLWFLVINLTDPTESKTFTNIPVNLVNTDKLGDDKVFEVIEGTDVLKSVTVWGPNSIIMDLNADNIIAEANFENLTATQTIEIEFASNLRNNELEKITGSASFLKLNIENKKTSYLSLKVEVQGEVAEGFIIDQISPEQNRISVSGPESLVSHVKEAIVVINVNEATDNINTRSSVKLYGEDGVEIISDALNMSFDIVSVSAKVLATKWLTIEHEVVGIAADGYQFTGEVTSNPARILVSGTQSVLNNINSIKIPGEVLNIAGEDSDFIRTQYVNNYLADGVGLVTADYDGKIITTVKIEPIVEKTLNIDGTQISLINIPTGLNVSTDVSQVIQVKVQGLDRYINALDEQQIKGIIDIEGYIESYPSTILDSGIYMMPLVIHLEEDSIMIENVVVAVLVN